MNRDKFQAGYAQIEKPIFKTGDEIRIRAGMKGNGKKEGIFADCGQLSQIAKSLDCWVLRLQLKWRAAPLLPRER